MWFSVVWVLKELLLGFSQNHSHLFTNWILKREKNCFVERNTLFHFLGLEVKERFGEHKVQLAKKKKTFTDLSMRDLVPEEHPFCPFVNAVLFGLPAKTDAHKFSHSRCFLFFFPSFPSIFPLLAHLFGPCLVCAEIIELVSKEDKWYFCAYFSLACDADNHNKKLALHSNLKHVMWLKSFSWKTQTVWYSGKERQKEKQTGVLSWTTSIFQQAAGSLASQTKVQQSHFSEISSPCK